MKNLILTILLLLPLNAFAINDGSIDNFDTIVLSVDSPQPIIDKGGAGAWDAGGMREISNPLDDTGDSDTTKRFKMIYPGFPTDNSPTNEQPGYAYSADGLTWTKYASNPVSFLGGGNWYLEDPYILKNGSTYYIFYEDKTDGTRIGLRTSTDFVNWSAQTVVLTKGAGGTWDSQDVSSPVVWIEAGTWYMLFEGRKTSGQQGEIGLATSPDGTTWTESGSNPVMLRGTSTAWDNNSVVPDDVVKVGSTYYMNYHGQNSTTTLFQGRGLATSTDLTTWTKDSRNPVFSIKPSFSNVQPFQGLNHKHYSFVCQTNQRCFEYQFIKGSGLNVGTMTMTNVNF